MNVSVPTSIPASRTKTIPTFWKEVARYAFLFKLDITDYKDGPADWKRQDMPPTLLMPIDCITIIEDYDLYKYDSKGVYSERKLRKNPWLLSPHPVYIANDIAYIVARSGILSRI